MYFNTIECPYCGYENDTSDWLVNLPDDNCFDQECENCEKEFEVEVEFEPIYSASKIEYTNCERCNKLVRDSDTYNRGRIFPYPKNIKEDLLCEKCYRGLMYEEWRSKNENKKI